MRTRTGMAVCFGIIALLLPHAPVAAATIFATPAFQRQWNAVELVRANFWGPLGTAHDGQQEDYREAPGGKRTVQYFDKARMELTNPASGKVTNGLLTVEMKSGKVQVGDTSFVLVERTPGITGGPPPGAPSAIKIAGDGFGRDGPSYADLNLLPERDPAGPDVSGIGLPGGVLPWKYDNLTGRFTQTDNLPALNIPPGPTYGAFVGDPGRRYGQYVFRPFNDFIYALPLPMSQTTGYPISPLIIADVTVGGKPATVLIQAFERRVLTFTPNNPAAFRVEFGNIGNHYYEWRYHPGA